MEELLPIGSIVTVENKDLMICAYLGQVPDINGKKYDYACCSYPIGITQKSAIISKNQIERIKFLGFKNKEFYDLKKELEKIM